ncbi:MAG TPA: hypothetical protein VLN73_05765 [Alphaproteobacteria bacterium]|nr:hypothetical protein [Alphaproteobacteria bacterium]
MYSHIVNTIKSLIEIASQGTVLQYAVVAGLAVIAFCLLMILWKIMRHALFCLKRSWQLSEWQRAKTRRRKSALEGEAAQ